MPPPTYRATVKPTMSFNLWHTKRDVPADSSEGKVKASRFPTLGSLFKSMSRSSKNLVTGKPVANKPHSKETLTTKGIVPPKEGQKAKSSGKGSKPTLDNRITAMEQDVLRLLHVAEATGRIHITHQPERRRSTDHAKAIQTKKGEVVSGAELAGYAKERTTTDAMQEELLRLVAQAEAEGRIQITHSPPRRSSLTDLGRKKTNASAIEELMQLVQDAEQGGHVKILREETTASALDVGSACALDVGSVHVVPIRHRDRETAQDGVCP
mmetsp:Transcript_6626/g.13346  ORF Transcript_6626/g.13346 Transcript_6626/m.13346 type:complete len:268 (-) Transcript_6626:88-891(-)